MGFLTQAISGAFDGGNWGLPGFYKLGTKRAEHLDKVDLPMLFLQGTRDTLADLSLLRPMCSSLGSRAKLHGIDTVDHSFHVLKSSGRTDADFLRELAQTTASWAENLQLEA
jgi:predicted alpha/beta-hydrolase family hydrolase